MFGHEPAPDGRNVMLLLPQYKFTCPLTLFSVLGAFSRATAQCAMEYGDAYIAHARNGLAHTFLASKAEWALCVDDDMVIPMGNASWFKRVTGMGKLSDARAGYSTIDRLLSHGVSLVGGLYFTRTKHRVPLFGGAPGVSGEELRAGVDLGLVRSEWVATGCMLVHRSVFLDIQKTFPHLAPKGNDKLWQYYSPSEDGAVSGIDKAVAMLDAGNFSEARDELSHARAAGNNHALATGEDVIFCRRAAAAGHQPHVDTSLVCGHVGQHVFGIE